MMIHHHERLTLVAVLNEIDGLVGYYIGHITFLSDSLAVLQKVRAVIVALLSLSGKNTVMIESLRL